MEGGEQTGACPWWGGVRGALPPPPRNWKKDAVRRNFNLFHLCFTNEIKGGGSTHTAYTYKMEGGVGGQAIVHGGGEGALPPPLENEKKRLSKEILSSFTYVLLMKLGGGDRHTLHTIACPHENKKKAVRGNFNNNYIAWVALHMLHCMGCIAWAALHGLHCMGCIAWVALHWLHCMGCIAWAALHI